MWLLVTAPIVWFYAWTATSSWGPFHWRHDKVDHYNLLADGFLSGRLHMKLDPPAERRRRGCGGRRRRWSRWGAHGERRSWRC